MKNDKPQTGGSPEDPAFADARRNDANDSLWRPRSAEFDAPLRPHFFHTSVRLLSRIPRILVTPDAYKRMLLFLQLAPVEVGWLGSVTVSSEGDFVIDQVFLLKQTVSNVETELSNEGLNDLVLELLNSGGTAGVDAVNRLRFWGHSHVRMHTEPSLTDEKTMANFAADGLPWAVRGIFNKLGRAKFTLFLYKEGLRIDDAPWAVWNPQTGSVMQLPPEIPVCTGGALSFFGFGAGPSPDAFAALPAELKPSEELRASVAAEYQAKVKERNLFRTPGPRLLAQQQRTTDQPTAQSPGLVPGSHERSSK